jgi:hypothetical protein
VQPLDNASSKMQTSAFGKSKGLWSTLKEGSLGDAFHALGISILLTTNPAIQVPPCLMIMSLLLLVLVIFLDFALTENLSTC